MKNNRGPQLEKLPIIEFEKATEADIAIENCMLRAWVICELVKELGWAPVVDMSAD